MKKGKMIIELIAILVILTIASLTGIVNATIQPDDYKPSDLDQTDYYKPFKMAGVILNAITVTGVVVAVITVMFLGIKYMVGSVEEKAEYKKTMMPILVGMILLFCTSTIVSIIWNVTTSIKPSSSSTTTSIPNKGIDKNNRNTIRQELY